MRAPCGLSVVSHEAFILHVCRCPVRACCDYGSDVLMAAAAFRRGGAEIDMATLMRAERTA
jgi:hypothetical protein